MSAIPSALQRLWDEFEPHEPDAILSGIYAAKSGYHNTRANHLAGRNGGSPSDYSIQAAADKRGPALKAAAIDITFDSARRSDFAIIDKYTSRVIDAMKRRDPRLFYKGDAVWREVLGNADSDREVEGWSLYRGYAITSDPSHLWHMHLSCHREFVENWHAVSGMLDILLDRDTEPSEEIDMGAVEDLKEYIDNKVDAQTDNLRAYMTQRTYARINDADVEKYGYRQGLFQVGAMASDGSLTGRESIIRLARLEAKVDKLLERSEGGALTEAELDDIEARVESVLAELCEPTDVGTVPEDADTEPKENES